MPQKFPVAEAVDFTVLADKYDFAAGSIHNVITKAAEMATLQNKGISMEFLLLAAEAEKERSKPPATEYSVLYQ